MAKKSLIPPEKCPSCGTEFHCSPSGKCWCYELDLNSKKLEEIKDKYDKLSCVRSVLKSKVLSE